MYTRNAYTVGTNVRCEGRGKNCERAIWKTETRIDKSGEGKVREIDGKGRKGEISD